MLATPTAEPLVGEVSDDLVHVHEGRRTCTGLKDVQSGGTRAEAVPLAPGTAKTRRGRGNPPRVPLQ
jgi:hypothetical protein